MNQCLILGYNSPDKITWIIFIVRQEIPKKYRAESFSDHWSTFLTPILPKPLTYLRCRLGLIVLPQNLCQLRKLCFAGLHNQGVHDLDIFISGGIFGATRLSVILNALSSLCNYASHFFSLCYKKETPSQRFP